MAGGTPNTRRHLNLRELRKPARLAHAVLRTAHLEDAIRFYRLVLASDVVERGPDHAVLSSDAGRHRLGLLATAGPPGPPFAAGIDHLAWSCASLHDLLAAYARLKTEGVVPVWCVNHGATTSLYYQDPDGIRLELQVDNFETEAELKGFMGGEEFANNPIGVDFDADHLLERYLSGEQVTSLLRPPGGDTVAAITGRPRTLGNSHSAPPAYFAHAVLRARDLDASLVFYQRLLGASVTFKNDMIAFVTFDHEHHRLALGKTPQSETATKDAPGLGHLSFVYAELGDLLQTYARLKSEGTLPVRCVLRGPIASLFYEDPECNQAELQAEVALRSGGPQIDHGFLDVEFDADELLGRYLSGESLDTILQPSGCGSDLRSKL